MFLPKYSSKNKENGLKHSKKVPIVRPSSNKTLFDNQLDINLSSEI